MKLLIKSTFVFLLVIFVLLFALTIFLGYNGVLDYFIKITHSVNYTEKIYKLVSQKVFRIMQIACIFPVLFLIYILSNFNKIYNFLSFYVSDFRISIKRAFGDIYLTPAKYILILPILTSVYFAITLPVSYDEAVTYLNFTSKSVISSISYYPVPNNHVLNSIVTNFTSHIPFLSNLLSLRISSVIINVFVWVFATSFLSKFFNRNFALVVVAITSTLFMSIYYSYMARGYALLELFFIIALHFSFNIIKGDNSKRNWLWFSVSSILGFYTIPSFLYPFVTLNVIILIYNYKNIRYQIISNVLICCTVVLLYLPIIIVNGLKSLTSNPYVLPIPRSTVLKGLPSFFTDAITDISGISWMIILIFLALSFVVLLIKKEKNNIAIFLIFIVLPFVILLLHSVIPFSRTFVYYGFLIVFLICLPLKNWISKIKITYIILVSVFLQSILVFNFYHKIYAFEDYSLVSKNTIQKINTEKKIICNATLFNSLLLFEMAEKKIDRGHLMCFDRVKMSADTIMNQDYIILEKEIDETVIKTPKIKTSYYSIY